MEKEKMFEGEIKAGKLLNVIDTVQVVNDECVIEVDEERWYIKEVDNAHVCMVEQYLSNKAFEHYNVDKEPTEVERRVLKESLKEQLTGEDVVKQIDKMCEEREEVKARLEKWIKDVKGEEIAFDEVPSVNDLLEKEILFEDDIRDLRDDLWELLEEITEEEDEEEDDYEYETEVIEPDGKVAVNLNKLKQALNIVGKLDLVDLRVDKQRTMVEIETENFNRKIPLLDPAGFPEPNIPELDLPIDIVIDAHHIKKGVKSSNTVSDHLKMEVDDDRLIMASYEDEDEVEWIVRGSEIESLEKEKDGDFKSLFALDYLSDVAKKMDGEVEMNLGEDYPMSVVWEEEDGEVESHYLLAPRIEST